MKDNMKKNGFSLIELMVVLIILGIITGFAVGSFESARQRNVERTIAAELRGLSAASKLYKAKNRNYWDVAGVTQNEAAYQAQLGTNIGMDDAVVTYNSSSPDSFAFYAVNARHGITIRMDILGEPCCSAGTCRGIPTCGACPAPYTACDLMCVDTQTDRGNCLTCGTTCIAGDDCVAGACV